MANWYFSPFHSSPQTPFRKKKGQIPFLIGGSLLALVGSWLVWSLLESRGLNPFTPAKAPEPALLNEAFMPSVAHWEDQILNWADEYALDPLLVATVMQIESCGNPSAISPADAQGLFQVMPYHFAAEENMLDPQTNAARGLAYLNRSYEMAGGDIELTLAGYNGGHGQIARDRSLWPEETLRYVTWGNGIYQDAVTGDTNRLTLTAWLRAGGQSLCDRAETSLNLK